MRKSVQNPSSQKHQNFSSLYQYNVTILKNTIVGSYKRFVKLILADNNDKEPISKEVDIALSELDKAFDAVKKFIESNQEPGNMKSALDGLDQIIKGKISLQISILKLKKTKMKQFQKLAATSLKDLEFLLFSKESSRKDEGFIGISRKFEYRSSEINGMLQNPVIAYEKRTELFEEYCSINYLHEYYLELQKLINSSSGK